MTNGNDTTLEYLLDLDGERFVVDEKLGFWVKFEIRKTKDRACGVRYSLSLHDKNNERIMGFDNAHEIKYGGKQKVAPKRTYDHWHRDEKDKGRPYAYENAAKLMDDFWNEVEKRLRGKIQ